MQGKFIQTADYVVFCVGLCISLATGIIFAYRDRNHKSPFYFHRGGGKLTAFPVAMSMIVTYESSIFYLGYPAEVYVHGFMFFIYNIGFAIGYTSLFMISIPLFYPLQITSVYEYLQKRYDSPLIRKVAMAVSTFTMLIYQGIVLFGAAVALESVTGISEWIIVVSMSVIAVIYTSLGGLKAVVTTDVVQGAIMIVMILVVLIYGTLRAGGVQSVIDINKQSGRLKMLDFDPNPLIRHSFWTLLIGGILQGFSICYRQGTVQRFNSTRSIKEAKNVAIWSFVMYLVLDTLAMVEGLVVYAYFSSKGCDPLASGQIKNPNQILSYAVLDMFENIPGLTGLFMAALCSATLSTISSILSCVSAVVSEDFIRARWKTISDARLTKSSRAIVLVCGIFCIFTGLLLGNTKAPLMQISTIALGVIGCPMMTTFIMSFFVRSTTKKGLLVCTVVSLIVGVWLLSGYTLSKGKKQTPWLPLGPTDKCNIATATHIALNVSLPGNVTETMDTGGIVSATHANYSQYDSRNKSNATDGMNMENTPAGKVNPRGLDVLYSLSYLYFTLIIAVVSLLSGIIASKLTKVDRQTPVPDNLVFSLNKQFFKCRPKYEAVSNCLDVEVDHGTDEKENTFENENVHEMT